jgi:hypothetical protein
MGEVVRRSGLSRQWLSRIAALGEIQVPNERGLGGGTSPTHHSWISGWREWADALESAVGGNCCTRTRLKCNVRSGKLQGHRSAV